MNHRQNQGSLMMLSALLLVQLLATASASLHILSPRQSSDGCGPNPLVAIISYAREFADFSPQQLMRFIETDTKAGSQLRVLLRTYDDCVRTGDGARYKRMIAPSSLPDESSADYDDYATTSVVRKAATGGSNNKHYTLSQVNESLLRALAGRNKT